MIKIIWDWNGTLLDDAELCFGCINRLLGKNKLPVLKDLDAYRNVFGFPIQAYYERCGFDFSKTPWEDLAADYMHDYMERSPDCSLTPGALEALFMVKRHGFDNIILSASRLDYLKDQISWFPLTPLIDAVYGIDDIYAHSKLELSRSFLKTCLPGDQLYWIGDSLHDAENAAEIGASCILVETGHQSRERLLEAGVPVKRDGLEAVEYLLKQHPESPWIGIAGSFGLMADGQKEPEAAIDLSAAAVDERSEAGSSADDSEAVVSPDRKENSCGN